MYRKLPLWIREICWFFATVALYLSVGWCIWQIWSATFNNPRSVFELALPVVAITVFFWLRRKTRRVTSGPLYRRGMQAYLIGQMRYT